MKTIRLHSPRITALEASAAIVLREMPEHTILTQSLPIRKGEEPTREGYEPPTIKVDEDNPVSESRRARVQSPRQKFLSALMHEFSGETGEKAADAFVKGDSTALADLFAHVASKLVPPKPQDQPSGDPKYFTKDDLPRG